LALDRLLSDTPTAPDRDRPRLWVDRSFAASGAGTVVTGTLTGGSLAVGDELEVRDRPVRVRSLQSLGQTHERLGPGNRTAVNLVGVHHHDVARGDALVHAGQWHRTRTIDASLRVLDALDHEVSRRGAYVAYIGSGEHPVRLRILGPDSISPGEQGLVRLHLPMPLPLVPGDRYVLRESGRSETVGGGEVLDVEPVLRASKAQPNRSVARVVAEHGWIDADELERLTSERRPATVGRWVVDPDALALATTRLEAMVDAAGPLGLDIAALDERDRAVLATLDGVVVSGGRAATAGADDPLAGHPFVAALEAAPFTPPSAEEAGVDRAELRELVKRGLVVEQDGIWFAPSAIDDAAARIAALLRAKPDGVTVAEVREALGTTRKWAVPLLTLLDGSGVTRRRGDVRVAGPRLPT
jgi:selenocysteine-specific elongation factor